MATSSSSDFPPPFGEGQYDIASGQGDGDSELPTYSQAQQDPPEFSQAARRETKDFEYKLGKIDKPLLVLTLSGDKAFVSDIPVITEGTPIRGKVDIETDKPRSITAVELTIKGSLVTGGANFDGYTFVFLEQQHKLWSEETDPNVETLPSNLPFSIDLPKEVPWFEKLGQEQKKFSLPQSFSQRYTHATIKYEILVKLVRKGIFRSDETLSTPFVYMPITVPPPLPPLRRLAYEEGSPLPGPKVDPDGWYFQKAVQIEGTLFNSQSARVDCKWRLRLTIGQLSYTRGSFIPLFLTLESEDKHALDLLSTPKSIAVRVRRRIKYAPTPQKPIETANWRTEIDHSQRAVWWPAVDNAGHTSDDKFRMLNGELHLKPSMVPTSAMGMYKVEYSVIFLPFSSPGFNTNLKPSHVLLEQPITVVTAFAPGPRPKASTPAVYEPDADKSAAELQTDGEFSFGFY
ncbi:hypothetical protein CVT26_013769 [Gymnopilus dilepis]|uniref:Arrestin-like N-terminal domain-containing protein n=1 Tax=Gymnopilus dilepis TaxID=231916 RepID=A0A409Y6C6_9AGAR|nr:hypothetical protein CVT26_013769 [Gymnopilus dilepis]